MASASGAMGTARSDKGERTSAESVTEEVVMSDDDEVIFGFEKCGNVS